nr:phage portal protein [uncultured Parasutterella sp.]
MGDSQFKEVLKRFSGMAKGDGSGLFLVDRGFNYSSMSLSPQDAQLLETRKYNVEEICRWFGVPPVLIGASGVTTWGSGIAEIVSGFHKFTLAPLCTQFQQALTRKLNHVWDRDKYTIEMKLDALLRSNPQERAAYYSQMAQNGMMTRNEVRGLENLPPAEGGDELTAQSNLVPLKKLGQVETTSNPPDGSPVRQ